MPRNNDRAIIMRDEEIIHRLRTSAREEHLPATELTELLDTLTEGGLGQGSIITYFKRAFPSIPLNVLLDAGAWHRISDGNLSDSDFNEMLEPWLDRL